MNALRMVLRAPAAAGETDESEQTAGDAVPTRFIARRRGCRARGRPPADARRREKGVAALARAEKISCAAAGQCCLMGRTALERTDRRRADFVMRSAHRLLPAAIGSDRGRRRARLFQPAKKFFILSIQDLARGLWLASSLRLMSSNSFSSSFCRLVRLTGVSTTTWHIRSPG
jgi:hypothetical protein